MINVQVDGSEVRLKLAQVEANLRTPLLKILSAELRNQLVAHFRQRHVANPNKFQAPRQNFWLQVAHSVNVPVVTGQEAMVGISHPAIAQKVFGGVITAKRAGALTIPLTAEAYGRTASTFEHETGLRLFKLPAKAGKGEGVLAASIGGVVRAIYALRKSVRQAPDPNALPSAGVIGAALERRGNAWLARRAG